jgi:hypothetical protein
MIRRYTTIQLIHDNRYVILRTQEIGIVSQHGGGVRRV